MFPQRRPDPLLLGLESVLSFCLQSLGISNMDVKRKKECVSTEVIGYDLRTSTSFNLIVAWLIRTQQDRFINIYHIQRRTMQRITLRR